MCGICGIISPSKASESNITNMTNALEHRGPDGSGYLIKDQLAFGHRRLSIIDLEHGKQPMTSEDGAIWITFNGEIYNYKDLMVELKQNYDFRTNSDTETIIHLYAEKGEKFIKYIRGMFSLAIYDFREKKLIIARDHMGQKPLYYHCHNDTFIFASEIKAILSVAVDLPKVDEDAIYEYLTIRIITPPRSMFRGIKKLPPGHFLVYKDGDVNIQRYWHLNFTEKHSEDFDTTLEMLDDNVSEAVKYHLVSDVPVGSFLSGGLDSSLIVAMMSRHLDSPFDTFSGDVPYKGYSEIEYSRIVSKKYDTNNNELLLLPSLVRSLPKITWHLDEPSDPLSVCIFYLAELAKKKVKVVLGGDGGDELFGGYDRYYGNVLASYYSALPQSVRKLIYKKLIAKVSEGKWYRSVGHKMRWFHHASFYDGSERYAWSLSYTYFSRENNNGLFTEQFLKNVQLFDPLESIKHYFDANNADHVIDRMLFADSMVRLPDHPVMILDRMTMAHGLEARSPFLDHKLVEFCAKMPPKYKVRGTKSRYIQSKLAQKYLPNEILKRRKQGFSSPLLYILDSEFRFLYTVLLTY